MLKLKLIIIMILISIILFLPSAFAQEYNIFIIGYGPIAGETGFPSACDSDMNGNIAILDGLKNAVIIYDKNFSFKEAFSVANKINRDVFGITFKFSLENYLYFFLAEEIFKYDLHGNLIKTFSLREKPYLTGKTIKNFVPLRGEIILAKDEMTGGASIINLEKNEEPKSLNIGEGAQIIDIDCSPGSIFSLTTTYSAGQSGYKILKFSETGELIKEIKLEFQIGSFDIPIKISASPDGKLFILSNSFSYLIYDENLQFLKTNKLSNITPEDQISSFTGYIDERVIFPNPTKGVQIFKETDLVQVIGPVKMEEGKLLLPTSVAASNANVFVYDELTKKTNYYVYENLKRSFSVTDITGPILPAQSKIELNATQDGNLFIVSIGLELVIKKYNPQNGEVKTVKIPEYIPPRSSVYVRPEDSRIFAYSWFDSILYSFSPENIENIEKIQIKHTESPMYGSDNVCRVDFSGNIFIFSPISKRTNVFDKNGSLILNFNLNKDAYYSDFKFFSDYVVFLDQINGKLELYSKRGEMGKTIGEFGTILYPKDKNGYSEEEGKFNFPSSISCTKDKIYIADSCNSRIQVIEMMPTQQKIVVELQIGSKSAYVNGIRKDLDVPPFIENGRTLVPFRFIGEALGARVDWISAEKKAIYELKNVKVEVIIGSKIAYVNGKPVTLEVPAKISNGRTFIPLRFVSEALGSSVIWEAQTKRIIITYPAGG